MFRRMTNLSFSFALVLACGAFAVAGEEVQAPAHAEKAGDEDVSKKSFKKDKVEEEQAPPAVGEAGYVRRSKVDLMSAATGGTAAGSLAGGAKVMVSEDGGAWFKVSADGGASGFVKKEDLRKKPPVEWHSNREDITYQECLGKECEGKKAKKVDKKDVLLEIDRGGPKNAFVYVKMPGDVYGWVPVAYMREWKEKFD